MQLVFKLLITEAIGVLVGLAICVVLLSLDKEDSTLGKIGAILTGISAFALVMTWLWYVWSL